MAQRSGETWEFNEKLGDKAGELWDAEGEIFIAEFTAEDCTHEQAVANGKLAAAAPDFLRACEQAEEFLKNGTPIHPGSYVAEDILAALRKAKS